MLAYKDGAADLAIRLAQRGFLAAPVMHGPDRGEQQDLFSGASHLKGEFRIAAELPIALIDVSQGLQEKGAPFQGLLYPGLKLSADGPKVLEFNARFGDPETQVYMRLLATDPLEIFNACVDGRLDQINIQWREGYAACVVMASQGYPSPDYLKGVPITGIEDAELLPDVFVFHAGTALDKEGKLVTAGGRVLGVTGFGPTLQEAIYRAYAGVRLIHFDGMQYRRDIGATSFGQR